MNEYKEIEDWLENACFWIKWAPDREAVKAELRGHYDDHRDALLEAGLPADDAGELAVRALGSPDEVGWRLAEVYNTLWSRLWRLSRAFVRIACVLLAYALLAGGLPRFVDLTFLSPLCTRYYGRAADAACRELGNTIAYQYGAFTDWTVGKSGPSGDLLGFRWKVHRWARMKTSCEGAEFYQFNAALCVRDTLLYAPDLCSYENSIYAVDDLGNTYEDFTNGSLATLVFHSNIESNGRLLDRQYFTVRIDGLDENAEWVELRLDGGDETLRLRIDLTEGEAVA